MQKLWDQVDEYFARALSPDDDALTHALTASAAAGLPAIAVTPNQGKLLAMLVRVRGAKRILEIGTLGGYSTIWMARALPKDGKLVTIEISEKHADVARRNLERAKVADRVEIVVAPALDALADMKKQRAEPFEFVFIDADKANIDRYFRASLELSARGAVIVVDNVVREGAVVDAKSKDANVQGVRRLTEFLTITPRATGTAIQTVGTKGYDGFIIATVG